MIEEKIAEIFINCPNPKLGAKQVMELLRQEGWRSREEVEEIEIDAFDRGMNN